MEEQTLASTIIKKIAEILLIFMASVMIILVFWGVNKGFDITDEAYYLMGYRGGQEKLTNLSFFNLLEISKLFGWLNYLIQFRLLSIVLIIISSIIFSLGFYRFIQGIYSNKKCVFRLFTIIIWFIGVGFSFCTALPLTFSYNVFVQVALSSIAGLLLYILSFQNISQMKFRLWLTEATIGFLTAMVLLVKPTSAILIAIINVCIIGVLVSRNRTITLLNLAFLPFLGGLVLGLVVVLFGLNTFNEFKFAFTSGQVFTTPGYGLSLLLINAIKDICSFLIQIAWISWFYIVTFLLLLFQKSLILDRRFRSLITISISSWAIIFFAIYDFKDIYINSINGSLPISGFIFTGIFLFIVLIASQILERDKSVDNNPRIEIPAERKFLGVGLLIILPFVSAFGSSNPLSFQMWLHISPWCAILVILLQEFQNYRKFQSLVWGVFILFSLWLSFLWIGRYFYSPYRLVQNRLQQTELLSAQTGYLKGIRVDMPTKTFFDSLSTIARKTNYVPGDEIIEIAQSPGLVLYLGGYQPGNPWLSMRAGNFNLVCDSLKLSNLNHQKALLILDDDVIKNRLFPTLIECLNQMKVSFQNSYILVGELFNPYSNEGVEIYMPKIK